MSDYTIRYVDKRPRLTITQKSQYTVNISNTGALQGPEGPPGVQNLFVGPTPPPDPEVDFIWVQTL